MLPPLQLRIRWPRSCPPLHFQRPGHCEAEPSLRPNLCVRRNCPSANHSRPFATIAAHRLTTRLPWLRRCYSDESLPTPKRPFRRLWQARSTPRESALWPVSWSGSHRQSARRQKRTRQRERVCPPSCRNGHAAVVRRNASAEQSTPRARRHAPGGGDADRRKVSTPQPASRIPRPS